MTTEAGNISTTTAEPALHRESTWTYRHLIAVVVLIAVALAARLYFFDYKSIDFVDYYHKWYDYIKYNGGFRALRVQFGNYNYPYLYLLAFTTYLPLSPLVAVKAIAVLFDALLGWFSYRLIGLRHPAGWLPLIGAAVVVLLPTVVLDSSMWGQDDSSYAALGVGGLYFLLRRKPWAGCALLGLALAFKLQAIFLFPVLLLLVLRKWTPWKALLAIPGAYLLLDVPAWLLGANVKDSLLVYYYQATRDMMLILYNYANHTFQLVYSNAATQKILTARGAKTSFTNYLTQGTQSVFRFLPWPASATVDDIFIIGTVLLVLALIAVLVLRRVELTPTRIVLAATVSALLIPFLLPKTYDRYFFLADVLTVVAAFWLPRKLWAVPVLTQFASLFAYLPFLLLPYRLRTLSHDPGVASGSGLTGQGFVEPHSLVDTLPKLAPHPFAKLSIVLGPVVSFQLLAAAVLVSIVITFVIAVRHFRGKPVIQ